MSFRGSFTKGAVSQSFLSRFSLRNTVGGGIHGGDRHSSYLQFFETTIIKIDVPSTSYLSDAFFWGVTGKYPHVTSKASLWFTANNKVDTVKLI